MRLTVSQLRRIIKEEVSRVMGEGAEPPTSTFDGSGSPDPNPFMIPNEERDDEYYENWEMRDSGGWERQAAKNVGDPMPPFKAAGGAAAGGASEEPPTSQFDGGGDPPNPFMIPDNKRDDEYYRNWEERDSGGWARQAKKNYMDAQAAWQAAQSQKQPKRRMR